MDRHGVDGSIALDVELSALLELVWQNPVPNAPNCRWWDLCTLVCHKWRGNGLFRCGAIFLIIGETHAFFINCGLAQDGVLAGFAWNGVDSRFLCASSTQLPQIDFNLKAFGGCLSTGIINDFPRRIEPRPMNSDQIGGFVSRILENGRLAALRTPLVTVGSKRKLKLGLSSTLE